MMSTAMEVDETVESSPNNSNALSLPLARVKKLMKADPEVKLVSADAVFLTAAATVI